MLVLSACNQHAIKAKMYENVCVCVWVIWLDIAMSWKLNNNAMGLDRHYTVGIQIALWFKGAIFYLGNQQLVIVYSNLISDHLHCAKQRKFIIVSVLLCDSKFITTTSRSSSRTRTLSQFIHSLSVEIQNDPIYYWLFCGCLLRLHITYISYTWTFFAHIRIKLHTHTHRRFYR